MQATRMKNDTRAGIVGHHRANPKGRSFQKLPADLVKQIVLIERDFTENRQEAYKRISQAIDEYLGNEPRPQRGKVSSCSPSEVSH